MNQQLVAAPTLTNPVNHANHNTRDESDPTAEWAMTLDLFGLARAAPERSLAELSLVADPIARLKEVNWDFPERIAHSDIEGLHPYPAKFVTELPRALLSILPVPSGTAVLFMRADLREG